MSSPTLRVISFSGMQNFPMQMPMSYVVWRSGSTYRAMNTANGQVEFSGTDPVVVFNNLCQTLAPNGVGGVVGIRRGQYNFTSGITISGSAGITFIGEGGHQNAGIETELLFNPPAISGSPALSGAITVRMNDVGFMFLKFRGTSGVTRLLNVQGNAQRGFIDHCYFDGQDNGARWVSGTRALHLIGDVAATYGWKITNSFFNKWEEAIVLGSGESNATFISNIQSDNCMMLVRSYSDLSTISNVFAQGYDLASSGRSGSCALRFEGTSFNNMGNNVMCEMMSGVGVPVIFASGAHKNSVMNIGNGQPNKIYVLDENTSGSNNYNRGWRDIPGTPTNISGASPFSYYNDTGEPIQVTIGGGTVNGIDIIKNSTTFQTSGTQGGYIIQPGDIIKVTYTDAPKILRVPF